MQQTSGLQADRQSWEQETHPNEQREASGSQVLPTEDRPRDSGHVPKTDLKPYQ
jgi:hypothetical protein